MRAQEVINILNEISTELAVGNEKRHVIAREVDKLIAMLKDEPDEDIFHVRDIEESD
jgi:hypothetical protein